MANYGDMAAVAPSIIDGPFQMTPHDLYFLEISAYSLSQWQLRLAPLGLHGASGTFVSGLVDALERDGIGDADVRVKGSAAEFFSSVLKAMPTTRPEWATLFEESHWSPPTDDELAMIEALWGDWMVGRAPPSRRPFDSLFCLEVARDRSDIDLQLSSHEATIRATAARPDDAVDPLFHPIYDFVQDQFAELALPWTFHLAALQSTALDRQVNIKLFKGEGPPDKSHNAALSAHFQDTDWRVV